MMIQTAKTQEAEPYVAPLAAGVAVNAAAVSPVVPETRTAGAVRSKYLSVGWWLPPLIRGTASAVFCGLGLLWLRGIGELPSGGFGGGVCLLLIMFLASASAGTAGKVVCRLIGLKEIDG